MRPRDWFLVGVRLFGLWVFYRGLSYVLDFCAYQTNMAPNYAMSRQLAGAQGIGGALLWYPAGYFALAFYLIFGAEHFTKWVFRERRPPTEADRLAALASKEASRSAANDSIKD